ERPTGSGDPYALRRAGLGVVRTIRENGLRFGLTPLIDDAGLAYQERGINPAPAADILDFLVERLRVQLRAEGRRHDVIAAAFGTARDDDLTRLEARANTVAALLGTDVGRDLLTAYRRAANILRIEGRKDGPHDGAVEVALLRETEETALMRALQNGRSTLDEILAREAYHEAIDPMAALRPSVDAFFDRVTVNIPEPNLRRNRLRLLNQVRATMDRVADFSQIEG
ncbi:MAG: glycine--tRNA ligase subunit beta, partial [Acetobacteraceae bacterium]|nr:glycine--tRNA ligase subunit beta [Acetobacteraceae bacterium]